jgi:hypothetical protein
MNDWYFPSVTEICEVTCRARGVSHIVVGDHRTVVIKLEKHWPVSIRPKELDGLTKEQVINLLEIKLNRAGISEQSPISRGVN